MNKKEMIICALEKMGFSPEIDNDGDVFLCYQLKNIYFLVDDKEDTYVSVMLPQFYEIEDGKETVVLVVCNKMTREMKMTKVFVDQTFKNVSATCEFFYANGESLEQNLDKSLQMLGVVRTIFRNDIKELSDSEK